MAPHTSQLCEKMVLDTVLLALLAIESLRMWAQVDEERNVFAALMGVRSSSVVVVIIICAKQTVVNLRTEQRLSRERIEVEPKG